MCAYIGGSLGDCISFFVRSQISDSVPNLSGNSLIHFKVPLSTSVQKIYSTSRSFLHHSSRIDCVYGQFYGQVCARHLSLLYFVYCLRMCMYALCSHMSSSCQVPAPVSWWRPSNFHNMHFNIALAQFDGVRLELFHRSLFVCHVSVHMLVLCGFLQNSCIALNSHFEIPEYQMSTFDSDDDSLFHGGDFLFKELCSYHLPFQHASIHAITVCYRWCYCTHASPF